MNTQGRTNSEDVGAEVAGLQQVQSQQGLHEFQVTLGQGQDFVSNKQSLSQQNF